MTTESQASSQDDRVQEIVHYFVHCNGTKIGDEKLNDYLLKGYRVINLITDIVGGTVAVTVLLSKEYQS
jgi:hypothetical protein